MVAAVASSLGAIGRRIQVDPLACVAEWWPHVNLYDKQREILYSIWDNDETYAPAANEMGKDYVGGLAALLFFLTRHPCRVVTTSAKDDHLDVLWGEMNRFITECKYPLKTQDGGPLIVTNRHIRKVVDGDLCGISYVKGMVANDETIASLQGHHCNPNDIGLANDGIPRSAAFIDEASSVKQIVYDMMSTWAKRMFIFGNTWPCNNMLKFCLDGTPDGKIPGGDIPRDENNPLKGYYRKVVHIPAICSPNVQLGLRQLAMGMEPTNELLIPGVKSYANYIKHRKLWDPAKQCVSLDARFYKGADIMLFPPVWLQRAAEIAMALAMSGMSRKARAVGVDPAEGGDGTAMAASDEFGLIDLVSKKTPDTSVIPGDALAFALKHGCDPENIVFDAGGGGKQHADQLRKMGYNVRTMSFGEAATPPDKLKRTFRYRSRDKKVDDEETKYIYKNRRAEVYGLMRELIDPINEGWGIPPQFTELVRQLSPIPLWYDEEGRLYLPPKSKKPDSAGTDRKITLKELLGCSPDEADAVALSVFGMTNKTSQVWAGVA